jgi:lipopolysaccharide transport system permease protein
VFLNPTIQLATMTIVFSTILRIPSQGQPFILFAAIGLVPWIFFSTALISATESVIAGAGLITNVYFPRELLVVAAIMIRLLDFLAATLVLAVLLVYYQQPVTWTVVWIPVLFALQFAFVIGFSLPLAAMNLFFHDVRYLVGVFLNILFFLTPIFYGVDAVPARFRDVYQLNPMARFIGSYRDILLNGGSPALSNLAIGAGTSLLALVAGSLIFRRLEPKFADRI